MQDTFFDSGRKCVAMVTAYYTVKKYCGAGVLITFSDISSFFFFFTYRERVEFSNIFLKFLNGENSGGMQSKRIYKSCKWFFKPLNTNFSKFFAQI